MTTSAPSATITVYSKPSCPQCDATKRALTKKNVPHDVIDITEDAQALTDLKAAGFQQVPVVFDHAREARWSGFRPDEIKKSVEHRTPATVAA